MLYYFQLDPKRIRWLDNEKRLVIRRRYLSFTNDDGSVVKVSVPLEWLSSRDYRWKIRRENILSRLVNSKDLEIPFVCSFRKWQIKGDQIIEVSISNLIVYSSLFE